MRSNTPHDLLRSAARVFRRAKAPGRGARLATVAVLVASAGGGLVAAGAASASPAVAGGVRPLTVVTHLHNDARPAAPDGHNDSWDTGACPSFLPGNGSSPGDVYDNWAPLETEAINQVEEFYGQNSSTDPSEVYADDFARGLTRAFMFADLVQAIDDVVAGKATTTEQNEVTGFEGVVQYGREWTAFDAQELFNAETSGAGAIESEVVNDIYQVVFGYVGLPWQSQAVIPSLTDLMNQAQTALWGMPATTIDDGGNILPNYPLGGAESAQAIEQTMDALSFLNSVGQTQVSSSPDGTNSSLDMVMGQIENALGSAGGGSTLADAVVNIANLGADLTNTDSIDSSLIESLVNVVWQAGAAVVTGVQIDNAKSTATTSLTAQDLQGALENVSTFQELFSDFVAMTLHSLPAANATGNDPDCRTEYKVHDGSTPPGPTGSDPTMTVSHFTPSGINDYNYTTQTLGGARTDSSNTSGEISDPGVIDWSMTRDSGPGAPRLAENWPVSQITYGAPGPPGYGYLASGVDPSTQYPVGGSFTISFNGSNGQQYTTAPLTISETGATVYPTDSQVEQAIINADPNDFFQETCPSSGASDEDPSVPANDQGQGPCTDWNPNTHYGTDLLVSGTNTDNNTNGARDYQVIFDIMVKGDLGGWNPVFTGNTQPCVDGGICILDGIFPVAGDNIVSQVLWSYQKNDVCVNDPATCGENATFGWGDQNSSTFGVNLPEPYGCNSPVDSPVGGSNSTCGVAPECQAVSPVGGMLQIEYVGVEGGNPNCDSPTDTASWVMTPGFRYQSYYQGYWTAYRVPPSVNTKYSFLSVPNALFEPGQAGIDPNCGPEQAGTANATCLVGQGTHWTSQFAPGDQILLYDPSNGSGNGTGGQLSMVRTVQTVVDDTHMILTTSAECDSGSDGNNCDFFNANAYTSFMNPADGDEGSSAGMDTIPCGEDCQSANPNFQFDIKKLTGINAGPAGTCATWTPSTLNPHPPTSGCYYSNYVQFAAQDGQSKGWWNVYLPQDPPTARPATRHGSAQPATARASGDGSWVHAPAITLQPQSVIAGSGATATFTVKATGSPAPKFQWQRSTDGARKWSNISGATASTYSVTVTSAEQGYDYRALVSNSNGKRTTQFATLSVASAPVITKNPSSTSTLHRGQNFSFTAAATGDPAPAPTWEISLDGGKTWQTLATGTNKVSFELPTSPVTDGPAMKPGTSSAPVHAAVTTRDQVRAVYQNAYGTATSHTATLNFSDSYPDVGVAASVSPDPVAAGAPASALLTVGNYSGVKATNVSAVTTFSTSLGLKSVKQISGPKAKCSAKAVTGGTAETCTWASLAGKTEAQFKATLAPKKAKNNTGTIGMNATLTQTDGIPSAVNVNVPIRSSWADLQLTGKGPKTAKVGGKFTDTVTVHNAGPSAATKADVTIALPKNLTLVKAAGTGAKCTNRKGKVTCTIAKISAGHSVKLTLDLKGAKKGSSLLTASVTAKTHDYIPANNGTSIATKIT